jgi:hypothetical protein
MQIFLVQRRSDDYAHLPHGMNTLVDAPSPVDIVILFNFANCCEDK